MAWSDEARAAAREARRRNLGASRIERRYRRSTRGINLGNQRAVRMGEMLERLERKADSWGREKHASAQITLQEKLRATQRRIRAWRSVNAIYKTMR